MKTRTAAARFARALFDVAKEQGDPRRAGEELAQLVELTRAHATLRHALEHPAIPGAAKRSLLREIASRLGVSGVVGRVVELLADQDRLALLPEVERLYQARLRDHLQIVEAEVTTAVPLSPERARQLEASLGRATGKRVTVVERVDPSILGGVVTRIGSTVYDGSVARHLARLRERLAEGV